MQRIDATNCRLHARNMTTNDVERNRSVHLHYYKTYLASMGAPSMLLQIIVLAVLGQLFQTAADVWLSF